jgi:hypothetical protein
MAGSGETWQCHDLRYRSAANLDGNPYVIPIETADMGSPFTAWSGQCGDVPAWTGAQVTRLIALIAWLCVRYAIPPVIIPDTKPGRRGLAYHRQGVPNSPEWKTGNLRWSSSVGKCCPDWRRIAQFKDVVVPAVRNLVNPPPKEDFDMTEAEAEAMFRRVLEEFIPENLDPERVKNWVRLGVNAASRDDPGTTLGGKLDAITAAVTAPPV